MEFRGLMGGLYRITEWIMRLSVINVLWIVCSLPFFYLVLAGLIATSQEAEYAGQAIVLISAVMPFTLFPATAAMFAVARKWVTGDEDVPLFKTFFRGYKENYLQSMLGGLLCVLFGAVLYVNYTFYVRQSGTLSLLSILFIVLAVILFSAFIHFFSILVHFHMKFWQIIKNSFLITIGNPAMTITLLVSNGIILWISVYKITFLIPFFMGSLMAIVSFWNFNRIFDRMKVLSEKQKQEEQEKEQEETESGTEQGESNRVEQAESDADPSDKPEQGSDAQDHRK